MKKLIGIFIETIIRFFILVLISFLGISIYETYFKDDIVGEVKEFVSNIILSDNIGKQENTIEEKIYIENLENKNNIKKTPEKFYNQLDQYSKIIYNELEENKENMKTGTYQIEFGQQFSKILSKENGQELLKQYYQTAIEAYTYDNPDVFYIDYSKLYLNTQTTTRGFKTTYNTYINSDNEENYLESDFNTKEKIDKSLQEIEKIKQYFIYNKKETEYENIKLVHDYLVESIEYDETLSQDNIYNLYGALVNKKSVCEGYAESFKYLMDALEIPCIIISGKATNSQGETENHAWNYVQIDGIWYGIDCTWDDPIIAGPQVFSNLYRYKYFLKGEEKFKQTHNPNGEFTKGGKVFKFPSLSQTNYN